MTTAVKDCGGPAPTGFTARRKKDFYKRMEMVRAALDLMIRRGYETKTFTEAFDEIKKQVEE